MGIIQKMDLQNVIGEGAAGCILRPGTSCDDKQYKNSISKYGNFTDMVTEIQGANLMKDCDPSGDFSVRLLGYCPVEKDEANKIKKMCSRLRYKQPYYKLTYEDAGQDISKVPIRPGTLDFEMFLIKLKPIFEGLVRMDQGGICHSDIKGNNIAYDGNKVRLIDYGLTTKHDTILHPVYFTKYLYWAPDLKILDAIFNLNKGDMETNYGIQRFYEDQSQYLGALEKKSWMDIRTVLMKYDFPKFMVYDMTTEVAEKELQDYYDKFKQTNIKDILRIIASKWDVYGLGVTLCGMLIKADKMDDVDYIKLVMNMTDLDMFERFSPSDCLKSFSELIKKKNIENISSDV